MKTDCLIIGHTFAQHNLAVPEQPPGVYTCTRCGTVLTVHADGSRSYSRGEK
jgi:hypothetical protein